VAGKATANLSVQYLRDLKTKLDSALSGGGARLDPYTKAHFSEASVRIAKALDAQYIYNTDDLGSGRPMPMFFFQPPQEGQALPRP
jgi:hypothetical protein